MTDPVISPDGKFMWIDEKWVSLPQSTAEDSPITQSTSISDSVVTGNVNISQNVVADSRLCQQCSAGNVILLKCTECPESFCELCNPLCHVKTDFKFCETVSSEDRYDRTKNPRWRNVGFDDGIPHAPDDTWIRFDENQGLGPFCGSCKELFQIKRNDFFKIENEKRRHNKEKEDAYQNQIINEKNKDLINRAIVEITDISKENINRRIFNKLRHRWNLKLDDLVMNVFVHDRNMDSWALEDHLRYSRGELDNRWVNRTSRTVEGSQVPLEQFEGTSVRDYRHYYTNNNSENRAGSDLSDEEIIRNFSKETKEYLEEFNNIIQKKLSLLDESQISEYRRKNKITNILKGLGGMLVSGTILFLLYI